jgi:hypothetical protein
VTAPAQPQRPGGTNGWAIAAFVLGILGGTILSVIFAIVALVQTKRGQRGRGLAIAALVISAAWIAVIASVIAYGLSTQGKSVRANDLRVGDCIKEAPGDSLPAWVKRVRCDRPHFSEVFALLTLPDTAAYPGEQVLRSRRDDCGSEIFTYAPDAPEGPTFRVAVRYPTAEDWAKGDRSLTCVAVSKHESWSSIRG